MVERPPLLLLHGAFRGGWQWDAVAERLRHDGREVLAPDLLGAGDRWRPDHPPTGLEEVLDDLAALVVDRGLHDLVVVGHSQGGFVAQALAQRVAERLRLLAFLDAPVPDHGQRAVDFGPAATAVPPRDAWIPPRPLDPVELGVPAEVAAAWSARLTPQSVALALDVVVLDEPAALAVPRVHAFCSRTPEGHPVGATRERRRAEGHEDVVLDAPHDAPLAAPAEVARWVRGLA